MPSLQSLKQNMKKLGGTLTKMHTHGGEGFDENKEMVVVKPRAASERKYSRFHNERSVNRLRMAIIQTQHNAHSPGALTFDHSMETIPVMKRTDTEAARKEQEAKEKAEAASQRGRRNSHTIGMIPEGLEIGNKRHKARGSAAERIRQSVIHTLVAGKDPKKQNVNQVQPSAGGDDAGGTASPKARAQKVQKSKTSLEIVTEQMQGGGTARFHPPSKEARKSIIDNFKHEIAAFARSRKSRCGIPIMHPASPNRMKWDLLLAVVLVWNLIEIPFQVCFDVEAECASAYDIFGLSMDIFFICDVVINFHTGYLDDGKYVEEPSQVHKHYIWHGFLLDFITSVPYARILNLFAGGFCAPDVNEDTASIALLPRLLRIFRIFKLVKLFRLVKLMNVISAWEEEAGIGFSRFLRMVTLFFQMLFLSHIAGCLFAFIALDAKKGNNDEWTDDCWVARYANETNDSEIESSTFRLYMVSFYWAITTLTTVGYGDILPFTTEEIILTVVVQFIGTLVFGYVMASITSVVASEDMTAMLIKKKIGELNEYMAHRDLSQDLRLRIRSHYEYQWKRTTIYDEEEILNSLPPFLRMDVACSMNLDLVKNVPVLAALGDDCMAMLVTKLKPLQLVPGEMVVKKGTVGHEMYFITEGLLDVYINRDDEYPKCSLEQGSYFGEPAILSAKPVKRSASIQARVFSQLESLSKVDFLAVAELFPDILKMLNEVQTLTGEADDEEDEHKQIKLTKQNTENILHELQAITGRLTILERRSSGIGEEGMMGIAGLGRSEEKQEGGVPMIEEEGGDEEHESGGG